MELEDGLDFVGLYLRLDSGGFFKVVEVKKSRLEGCGMVFFACY